MVGLIDDKQKRFEHWWPVSVQKIWQHADGTLERTTLEKSIRKTVERRKLGGARLAHYMFPDRSGPWSHSFEGVFSKCDNDAFDLCTGILKDISEVKVPILKIILFVIKRKCVKDEFLYRKKNIELDIELIDKFALLAFSIAIRSPYFRFKKSVVHRAFGGGSDLELAKWNIQSFFRFAQDAFRANTLKPSILFLRSIGRHEFIFGDGFFETSLESLSRLKPRGDNWVPAPRGVLLFPMSPEICALIALGTVSCHGIFPPSSIRVPPNLRTDNETNEIHGRTDYRHPVGA